MGRPKYTTRIERIPEVSVPLPVEAKAPILHFKRTANDAWNLLLYFEGHVDQSKIYQASFERHFHRLNSMVILSVVGAFERFVKETAAGCIDHLVGLVLDKRFDSFSLSGNVAAAHFAEGSVGKALCESSTWVDCGQINTRFRNLLADPFEVGKFYVFPETPGQNPVGLKGRYSLIGLIWQLRHTLVHNGGVVTRSDAKKYQLLTRGTVASPRLLWPEKSDVSVVKRYLDETAELINAEVGDRLAELLTKIYLDHPGVFDPALKAQDLANHFRKQIQVELAIRDPD